MQVPSHVAADMLKADGLNTVRELETPYYGGDYFLHFKRLSQRVHNLLLLTTLPFVIDAVPDFEPDEIMPTHCTLCPRRKPWVHAFGSGNLKPDIVAVPVFTPRFVLPMERHYGWGTFASERRTRGLLIDYDILAHTWIQPATICQLPEDPETPSGIHLPHIVELRTCFPYVRMAITAMRPQIILLLISRHRRSESISEYIRIMRDNWGDTVRIIDLNFTATDDATTRQEMQIALESHTPSFGRADA